MANLKDTYVHLKNPEGLRVVLGPGDKIPDWAEIDPSLVAEAPKPPAKKRAAKKKAPVSPVEDSSDG